MGGRGRFVSKDMVRPKKGAKASRTNGVRAAKKMSFSRVPFMCHAYDSPDEDGWCEELPRTVTVEYKSPNPKGVYDDDELNLMYQFVCIEKSKERDTALAGAKSTLEAADAAAAKDWALAAKYVRALNKDPSKKFDTIRKMAKQKGWKFKP